MESNQHIKSLNGIRGFAVILVLLSHASNEGLKLHPSLSFSGAGRYGVFLFFILSAYLLTRQFLHNREMKEDFASFLKQYFIRRFLRIYPLFMLALFLYFILNKLGFYAIPIFKVDLATHLLLFEGKNVFWTIPVEFQYYFVLPLVALVLVSVKLHSIWLAIATLTISIIWWQLIPPKYVANLLPFFPIFLFGSVTAYLSLCFEKLDMNSRNYEYSLDAMAVISLLVFILLIPNYFNLMFDTSYSYTHFHEEFFLFAFVSSVLVFTTVHGSGIVKRMMESSFMEFWGKVSFSAYLGHMVILIFIRNNSDFSALINTLLFLSITAILSYLSFRYIESPLSKKSTYSKAIAFLGPKCSGLINVK